MTAKRTASAIGRQNRAKGRNAQRELVRILHAHGWEAEQTQSGSGAVPDVIAFGRVGMQAQLPGTSSCPAGLCVVFSVKNSKSVSPADRASFEKYCNIISRPGLLARRAFPGVWDFTAISDLWKEMPLRWAYSEPKQKAVDP